MDTELEAEEPGKRKAVVLPPKDVMEAEETDNDVKSKFQMIDKFLEEAALKKANRKKKANKARAQKRRAEEEKDYDDVKTVKVSAHSQDTRYQIPMNGERPMSMNEPLAPSSKPSLQPPRSYDPNETANRLRKIINSRLAQNDFKLPYPNLRIYNDPLNPTRAQVSSV